MCGVRMAKYRLLNRAWAYICGYFWIGCPVCRKDFGGHEWTGYLWTEYPNFTRAEGTCRDCRGDWILIDQKPVRLVERLRKSKENYEHRS